MIADLIVGVIIILLILRGLFRGFIKEVLFIVAVVGGLFIANTFWRIIDAQIKGFFPSPATSHFASYLISFIVGFVIVLIVVSMLRKIASISVLSSADKIAGGLFGLIKGIIICGAFLMFITFFWPKATSHSKLCPYVIKATKSLYLFVPQSIRQEFNEKSREIRKYFSEDFWYELFKIKKPKRRL